MLVALMTHRQKPQNLRLRFSYGQNEEGYSGGTAARGRSTIFAAAVAYAHTRGAEYQNRTPEYSHHPSSMKRETLARGWPGASWKSFEAGHPARRPRGEGGAALMRGGRTMKDMPRDAYLLFTMASMIFPPPAYDEGAYCQKLIEITPESRALTAEILLRVVTTGCMKYQRHISHHVLSNR